MSSFENVFGLLALALILGYFLYVIYYMLDLFFINPFKRIPDLTRQEEQIIASHLIFFKDLADPQKQRFKKRVVRFRYRKKIIFHNKVTDRDKIVLLLSATAVMLTLGMADFMILSIQKILVYPSEYYSRLTKKKHYGEYNPRLKTLVFSADHLMQGFKIPNDNINLAVHEFAHALSFNVKNKLYSRSYIFIIGMRKIRRLFSDPEFISKMDRTAYFRSYGKTNVHEFFAVSVENFVETPQEFKRQFPELFEIIRRMLNFGFNKTP